MGRCSRMASTTAATSLELPSSMPSCIAMESFTSWLVAGGEASTIKAVVGSTALEDHAVIWDEAGMHFLPTLGGFFSLGWAIGDRGPVGESTTGAPNGE